MPNFGSPIQTNRIPIKGLTAEASGTAPESPTNGQMWTDTSTSPPTVKYWNGTSWIRTNGADLPNSSITDAKVSASAGIALSKLAVNPADRANHFGTQLAATISDLATAVRTNRLDQMAVPTAPLDLNGQRVTNGGDPSSAQDLVTRQYLENWVTNRINNQDWKSSVRAATTGNVTLSGTQTVDGVSLVAGDRVLVKAQTSAAQNGIYVVAVGSWARASDANDSFEITSGMTVPVEQGTSLAGTIWLLVTANPITLGTTALEFVQIGAAGATYAAGTGLTLTGNEFALSTPVSIAHGGTGAGSAAAARTALGVGGIFSGALPELAAGVWTNVTHGLNTTNPAEPSIRDASTNEFVILDTKVIDANTVAVRAGINYAASALTIKVNG